MKHHSRYQPFDRSFLAYEFEGDPVFLRDVDAWPVVISAARLLGGTSSD